MPTSPVADFSVGTSRARDAFVAQAQRFLGVAEALDDDALLAASRCHGWAVLDVVVHVFTPEQRQFYNLERLWGRVAESRAEAQ